MTRTGFIASLFSPVFLLFKKKQATKFKISSTISGPLTITSNLQYPTRISFDRGQTFHDVYAGDRFIVNSETGSVTKVN
ncbi:MAG: hypothetical protein QM762_12480 [Chryseolinea sp.]